ncbi:MAG: exodeoxyribonuclease VII small subunit [Patescibacteria group bacterium]
MGETPKKTFEEALARLEEIVARLEMGEQTLEESLALFEEGVVLARFCQGVLSEAEGRLQILAADGAVPFQPGEGGAYNGGTGGIT